MSVQKRRGRTVIGVRCGHELRVTCMNCGWVRPTECLGIEA